jgi:hypothetical protein
LGCIDCPTGPWHIAHVTLALALPAAISAATLAIGIAPNKAIIIEPIAVVCFNIHFSCKKKDGGQMTAVLQSLGPHQV